MILHVLRALFVLLMAAVGWFFLTDPKMSFGSYTWLGLTIALVLAVLFVCMDILSPRRKLAVFSGTFLGLLVGIFAAYALSFVVTLLADNVISIINARDPTKPTIVDKAPAASIRRWRRSHRGMVCPQNGSSAKARGIRSVIVTTAGSDDAAGRLSRLTYA